MQSLSIRSSQKFCCMVKSDLGEGSYMQFLDALYPCVGKSENKLVR